MSQLPCPFNEPEYSGMIFMSEYSVCSQAINIYIRRRKFEGGQPVGIERAKLVWEDSDPKNMPEPTIVCRDMKDERGAPSQIQHLFNSLWQLGFRPPKHDPSGEVIQAKNENLDDLRTLLFHNLGIER
jgi:hypothetical protein